MAQEAGTRALVMYRRTRRRRRRRLALGGLGLALAAGAVAVSAPAGVALVGAVVGLAYLLSAVVGPQTADPDRWRRGAEGERRTADLLAALPARRWDIWHDLPVPGTRANIDHVAVGPTGVWVVDTKSTRAPVRARHRSVRFGDHRLDTSATRWEADVVAAELESRLGITMGRPPVLRPIVAVHGSGLRGRGTKVGGVRVVPAEALVARLRRGRRRLGRRDRRAVGDALAAAFGRPASGRR